MNLESAMLSFKGGHAVSMKQLDAQCLVEHAASELVEASPVHCQVKHGMAFRAMPPLLLSLPKVAQDLTL